MGCQEGGKGRGVADANAASPPCWSTSVGCYSSFEISVSKLANAAAVSASSLSRLK
ncbi:MAG: hypothetical protein ACKERG_04485 [Candidatus Hodgkinia cicadicola]